MVVEPTSWSDRLPAWLKWVIARRLLIWSLFAIVGLLGSLMYVTDTTRRDTIETVSQQSDVVAAVHSDLIILTQPIVAAAARPGALAPSTNAPELAAISVKARLLLGALVEFEAPSRRIFLARQEYRRAVETILGAVNTYDATPEGFGSLASALQDSANRGEGFRESVENFTGSSWVSFFATIF